MVRVVNKVTLRAAVLGGIKARFAGNGGVPASKRNAESRQHNGSRKTTAQAPQAAFCSLELATASPALARLAHGAGAMAERHLIHRVAH